MKTERGGLRRRLENVSEQELQELLPLQLQVFHILSQSYLEDGLAVGNKTLRIEIGGGVSRKRIKRARVAIRRKLELPRDF